MKTNDEKNSLRKSHIKKTLDDLKEVIIEERKCKHIPLSSLELHELRNQLDVWLIKFASDLSLKEKQFNK